MHNWQIKDLKGVGDVELNLDSEQRVFTFLGTNGVGKTKTLESLCLFLLCKNKNYILPDKNYDQYRFSFLKNNNEEYVFIDGLPFLNKYYEIKEDCFDALAYLGANQRSSIQKISNNGHSISNVPASNKNQISNIITYAIFNDDLSKLNMSDNIRLWFVERARFINPYQIEKDNSQIAIESILQCLHKIDNAFDDKFLQINENNNVYLKVNGEVLELSELSSGFLSLVKIIQSIIASFSAFTNEKDLLNVKGVVLIDEIESHLHLEWQVKIIPILKDLFPNTTFYITTHSPLVLSQLNEGEAYLLKRDKDDIVRSHLINSPNTRLLENVLQDAFGVNLNELKRQNMVNIDQSKAKKKLLDLLNRQVSQ